MLLKELMEKYGEYEINEEKLMELIQEPKLKSIYQIEQGDLYCYFDSDGTICDSIWDNYEVDKARLLLGNVFYDSSEAMARRKQLEIESLLLKYGGTRKFIEGGYMIEMRDSLYVEACYVGGWQYQGAIYFETEEQCQDAIEKIGKDRIKEELFQIK